MEAIRRLVPTAGVRYDHYSGFWRYHLTPGFMLVWDTAYNFTTKLFMARHSSPLLPSSLIIIILAIGNDSLDPENY